MPVLVPVGEEEAVAVGEGEIHRGVGDLVPVVVRLAVTVAVRLIVLLVVAAAVPVWDVVPVLVREDVLEAEAVRVGVPDLGADTVEETEAVPDRVPDTVTDVVPEGDCELVRVPVSRAVADLEAVLVGGLEVDAVIDGVRLGVAVAATVIVRDPERLRVPVLVPVLVPVPDPVPVIEDVPVVVAVPDPVTVPVLLPDGEPVCDPVPVFVGIEAVLLGDVVCVVDAVTVGVRVATADPEEVMEPEVEGVPVMDVVTCAVRELVAVVDAVPVFVLVAAAVLEPVAVLLAVTVGVAMADPDPEGVPDAVGAAEPVRVRVIVPD